MLLSVTDSEPPGVVQIHRWRQDPGISADEYEVSAWAAVARKT